MGTHPREMATGMPDGERILTWTQLYQPLRGSRGADCDWFGCDRCRVASAYNGLGSKVTLVSSRDRVLPGEDEDAARVLEDVFERRGVRVMPRSRAAAVERTEDGSGVIVTLSEVVRFLALTVWLLLVRFRTLKIWAWKTSVLSRPRAAILRWTACPARA